MDRELAAILEELPYKRPRSRLEPYRDLIVELRSRKLTFQDIAEVLAQKCGVRVTGSGIHDFLRRRSREAKAKLSSPPHTLSASDCITDLRDRGFHESDSRAFEFNPDEPLKLKSAWRSVAKEEG